MARTLLRLTCAFILLALLVPTTGRAQTSSDTATASAAATVVTAITITKDADLHFGDVVAGATSGTVVMSSAGVRSATGGTTLGNAGSASAASFTVDGDPSATYSISLPGSAVTLTSGGNTMTVDTFTSNPSGTGTLSAGGSQTIAVGATLNVGASQVSGEYTGTFDVTVAYN